MIGPKIIDGITEQIKAQLLTYQNDINRGYLQAEDAPFPISLGVKLRAGAEPGKVESAVHISLTPRKVKDSSLKVLSEDPELEFDKQYQIK